MDEIINVAFVTDGGRTVPSNPVTVRIVSDPCCRCCCECCCCRNGDPCCGCRNASSRGCGGSDCGRRACLCGWLFFGGRRCR